MNKALLYALSFILGQEAHAQQIDNPNIIRTSAPIVEKQSAGDSVGDSEWLAVPPRLFRMAC